MRDYLLLVNWMDGWMEMDSFEYFHYMIFPKHMVFLNKQYHRCDDFCRDFSSIYSMAWILSWCYKWFEH